MSALVLTLIVAENARADTDRAVTAVATALAAGGARPSAPDWLAPGIACDIAFDGIPVATAARAARTALPPAAPFDLVIQPAAGRKKRLLVADLESTIIANEMLNEMAALAGLGDGIAAVTQRAMNGEIDFAQSLRERVALFEGRPVDLILDAARQIRVTPGAATLVKTMNAAGAKTILVSGGFHVFAGALAKTLGFERAYANELMTEAGRLTGRVREPILDAAAKRTHLIERAAEWGIDPAATLAIGDGANDLPMLGAAGLGIAYHAKPHVRAQIRSHIDHSDLTALLYLQGYRAGELIV
ncbi:MAG: phosphoserine phosphatase SerB [Stellaceae bacterium]